MESLRRLFSRLRQPSRPNALEFSLLQTLPLELLLQIIEQLPAPSAAVFSISCMRIKLLTGTIYLEYLVGRRAETHGFLDLIARDLPDHDACPPCQKLHKIEDARKYTPHSYYSTACTSADRKAILFLIFGGSFSSTIFSMAMKRHQQNQECGTLLNELSHPASIYSTSRYLVQTRGEYRIINGQMIHRFPRCACSRSISNPYRTYSTKRSADM